MKKNGVIFTTLAIFLSLLQGCGSISAPTPIPVSELTNAELIQILENLENPNYAPSAYPRYLVVDELEKRGPSAAAAAPVLAKSMAYNERGSYQASEALIAIGPSAQSAIPYLVQNLNNNREEVRRHSIFVLGILGESSSCAVPKIALLLWDKEPYVRSVSAGALTEITNENLVEFEDFRLDPALPGSVNPDEPEGSFTKIAREWWLNVGQNIIWPTENCELPE